MNIEQAILENIRRLPLSKQQEVLDFSEFLNQKKANFLPSPYPNLTPEEKSQKWREVMAKLPQKSANLPDEALHRDTMYEDEY
jgi:hypothetical protein